MFSELCPLDPHQGSALGQLGERGRSERLPSPKPPSSKVLAALAELATLAVTYLFFPGLTLRGRWHVYKKLTFAILISRFSEGASYHKHRKTKNKFL